jgi:hypothetical protein
MKRLMILMVTGFLCLHLSGQDKTHSFYKQGELMLGVNPGYGSAALLEDNSGGVTLQAAFSNSLRIGYFVRDNWLIGVKSSQQIYTEGSQVKITVPNVAAFTRRYAGKGAWRAFFEAEAGITKGYRSTPTNDFESITAPYFQGGYGVAFRPGKGRMSIELSSALFNISTQGVKWGLPRPQLGINFHF